jgi:hypothetical protein
MLEWPEAAEVDLLDTEGYTLYMDDGHHGDLFAVYDGRLFPQTLRFLVTGLTTGLPYRFTLTTHNLNGESTQSAVQTIYACLRPSGLQAPNITSTTKTTLGIIWGEPTPNGCPVTGFTILRNSGADDPLTITVDLLTV